MTKHTHIHIHHHDDDDTETRGRHGRTRSEMAERRADVKENIETTRHYYGHPHKKGVSKHGMAENRSLAKVEHAVKRGRIPSEHHKPKSTKWAYKGGGRIPT